MATRGKHVYNQRSSYYCIGMKLSVEYVAGFVDGEGYISILPCPSGNLKYAQHTHYYRPVIKVTNINQEIIKRLHLQFGGYMELRRFPGKNQRDAYTWTVVGKKNVGSFLDIIYPYLILKKPQAKIIRLFLKACYTNYGSKGIPAHKIAKRKAYYNELRRLNKRGQPQRLSESAPQTRVKR